jgi:transcriptional regulator with XRE-family HTH domain
MLANLIENLTTEQRRELEELGITRMLLSRWRHAKSQPTEMQTVNLCAVTGAPYQQLQAEVTFLRAPVDQRERVAQVVGYAVRNRS